MDTFGLSPRNMLSAALLALGIWVPLFVVPPLETVLVAELGLTHAQTSLLFSGPIFMLAVFAIPAGLLADRYGVHKIAGIGAVFVVLGSGLHAAASTFTPLFIFTLLYGIGLGLAFPNLPKLVRHCTPRQKATFAVGVITSSILLSGALTLALTVPVFYNLTHSYHAVFLLWTIFPLVAAVLWWALIREPPCAVDEPPMAGSSTFRDVLRHRGIWLAAALFFLHNIFVYTWAGWMPSYMIERGTSPSLAGIITGMAFLCGIPVVLFLTTLAGRIRSRRPFIALTSAILAVTAVLIIYANVAMIWFIAAVMGMCLAVRFTFTLSLPVEMISREQIGAATGVMMSVGYLGALAGPWGSGHILDATHSYELVFYIIAGVTIINTAIGLLLPSGKK